MKKRLSVPIETDLHTALKMLAARRGISISELVKNLIRRELTS